MADKRLRDLERNAKAGDMDAAAQLAGEGGRAMQSDLVYTGVVNALPALSMSELRLLGRAVMNELATKEDVDMKAHPKLYKSEKAAEIHMPTLGKISVAKLVTILENMVEDCLKGNVSDNTNLSARQPPRYSSYHYSRRRARNRNKSEVVKTAEKAFSKVSGDFLISCSSPIRIYALQKQPSKEELEGRKRRLTERKLQEELEKKQAEILKAQKDAEKAAKKLESIKARLEKLHSEETSK